MTPTLTQPEPMTHYARRQRRTRIRQRLSAGEDLAAIAESEGVCAPFVRSIGRGIVLPERLTRYATYAIIAALIKTHDSTYAIAKQRGVSKQAVQQVYRKCINAGVPVVLRGMDARANNQ